MTTTLYPVAQQVGIIDSGEIDDDPVLVGGGSLSDDSDASYVQLGAYIDSDGNRHTESIAADFVSDSADPIKAVVIQARLKSDADVLADPPSPALNDCPVTLGTTDGTVFTNLNLRWASVKEGSVDTPEWFTWAVLGDIEDADPVDLTNPSDTGGWYVINSGLDAALRGDGLRVTFGAFWNGDSFDPDVRRAWIDLYELRVIVSPISPCYEILTATGWALGNGHNSTLTGDADTVWADGSDATYVTFSGLGSDSYGTLAPYSRMSGLDVTIQMRASSPGGDSLFVDLWNEWNGSTATNFLISVPFTIPAGGGIVDYQHTVDPDDLSDWGTTLGAIITGLRSDTLVAYVNAADDLTVYELSVRVGHKCVVNPPPLRRFPRADGLGIGPRRHYPPPESRRRVGGYY